MSRKIRLGKVYPVTKIIAIFVSVCFLSLDTLTYAAQVTKPVSQGQVQNPNGPVPNGLDFSLPKELGAIEESFQGGSGKTIFYIQDAHDSLEAQENIAKIIQHLVEHQGIKTVFEEGYEGKVPTDEYFDFIQDPKKREELSYFLMDKLRVSGAEYAHINRKSNFKLMGIDNAELYRENIKWYKKSAKQQTETREDLKALQSEITKLAHQHFPKELKVWMKWKQRFDEGTLDFLNYLNRMISIRSLSTENYPNVTTLLTGKGLNNIQPRVLFQEIHQLENDFAQELLISERDRQIFTYYNGLSLLERLNGIEVTPAEFEASQAMLESLKTEALAKFIVRHTNNPILLSKQWEENIQSAIRFYAVAHQRDRSIENHLNSFMRNDEDQAVLVFGGFHKNGIRQILKDMNISYQIISPKEQNNLCCEKACAQIRRLAGKAA